MMPNPYLYEKMIQAHHEDLLRESEQQQLLAHLPRDCESLIRQLAGKLGSLLVALGTSLQRLEPGREQAIYLKSITQSHRGGR